MKFMEGNRVGKLMGAVCKGVWLEKELYNIVEKVTVKIHNCFCTYFIARFVCILMEWGRDPLLCFTLPNHIKVLYSGGAWDCPEILSMQAWLFSTLHNNRIAGINVVLSLNRWISIVDIYWWWWGPIGQSFLARAWDRSITFQREAFVAPGFLRLIVFLGIGFMWSSPRRIFHESGTREGDGNFLLVDLIKNLISGTSSQFLSGT